MIWVVALSAWFIAVGVSRSWHWLAFPAFPIVAGLGVVAGFGCWFISIYYRRKFGRTYETVERKKKRLAAYIMMSSLIMIGMVCEMKVDPPVSAFGLGIAFALFFYYKDAGFHLPHHMVCFILLVLAALTPLLGIYDGAENKDFIRLGVGILPLGLIGIVAGILDHRFLTRSMRVSPTEGLHDAV
jgi:hypothetical protein